ncbi:hypothetical protein [Mesorhizobium sp. ORS 3428]|uniref:hypothetical protein n=1 Tax=Mesorhizobium sp. ORS 3428 TaxID=540997 RepID=UPI00104272C6|nr:hypothetical protein [Mesorhizobium sp. ORS 3428]
MSNETTNVLPFPQRAGSSAVPDAGNGGAGERPPDRQRRRRPAPAEPGVPPHVGEPGSAVLQKAVIPGLPQVSADALRFARIMGAGHPLDSPAVAVGVALYFATRCRPAGLPLSPSVLRSLEHHMRTGDATCRLVHQWILSRCVMRGRRQLWVHAGGRQ